MLSEADAKYLSSMLRSPTTDYWGHIPSIGRDATYDKTVNDALRAAQSIRPVIYRDKDLFVPSFWHALLLLLADNISGSRAVPPIRYIYRGHANCNWRLTPTIDRISGSKRAVALLETVLFSHCLRSRLYVPAMPLYAYIAAARHHGAAQKYIDFTGDPWVACLFAADQTETSDSLGRVLKTSVRQALSSGLRFFLPPICFKRSYDQIGVYLHSNKRELAKIDLSPAIMFPKPNREEDIRVVRNGAPLDILKSSSWIDKQHLWAQQVALESPDKLSDNDFIINAVKSHISSTPPAPQYMVNNDPNSQARSAIDFIDFLHWFALTEADSGKLTISDNCVLHQIVDDNAGVAAFAARWLQLAESMGCEQAPSGLINAILLITEPKIQKLLDPTTRSHWWL